MLAHHWDAVETDLHEHYGIDLEDRKLLRTRSWRWLRLRILGLLTVESRLSTAMTRQPAPEPEPEQED